jgi:hypothetical protein
MVWSCWNNAKPTNAETNCNSYNGGNKEIRETMWKMEIQGWRGFKYNGNKKLAANILRPFGMKKGSIGSQIDCSAWEELKDGIGLTISLSAWTNSHTVRFELQTDVNIKIRSSEMWCHVVWYIGNNVFEETCFFFSENGISSLKCWCLLPDYVMPHAKDGS